MIRAVAEPNIKFLLVDERPWKNRLAPQDCSNLTFLELADLIYDMQVVLTGPIMIEFPLIKGSQDEKREQMIEFLTTHSTPRLNFEKFPRHPSDRVDDDDYSGLVDLEHVAYPRLEMFCRIFQYVLARPLFTADKLCSAIRDNLLAEREPDKDDWRDKLQMKGMNGKTITMSQLHDIQYENAKKYIHLPRSKKYYAKDSPYRDLKFRERLELERMCVELEKDLNENVSSE
jgi:hypothetical protein